MKVMESMKKLMLTQRAGMLLVEVVVTVIIASTVMLGFGFFFVEATEQMRMAWQLRDMEEYGYYYTAEFREKIHNGRNLKVIRETPPCEISVEYADPWEPIEEWETYTFEFDRRARIPVIRRGNQVVDYPNFPPSSPSGRDEVFVDPSSFLIERIPEPAPSDVLPNVYDSRYRKYVYDLSFTMYYRRYPALLSRGVFEKTLPFSSRGYLVNVNWQGGESADTSSSAND
ncbi:hypothetical protein KQI63_15125 [bacterium]|nr:hypothetical protein [bacterium]